MSLGQAQSESFNIGTAEIRLAPLASAMKLSQANSIGLIDEATVTAGMTSVQLKGGFPRKMVASAITEKSASVSAKLREYSQRNWNILMGNGIVAEATPVATTVTADALISASSLEVGDSAGLAVGDLVVIYQEGKPESVSVVQLTGVDTVAPDGVSFAANSLAQAYATAGGTIHLYKVNPVSVGAANQVNYFSGCLIQQAASGQPLIWNFWKLAVSGDVTYGTNATDYASTDMKLDALEPTVADYAVGGPLNHVAALIPDHPFGFASFD